MPFVNELVPEEDKQRIDFGSINYPFKGYPSSVYKWTVDRERDVFLLYTSCGAPDSSNTYFFVFGIKGELLRMELSRSYVGSMQDGWVYTWHMPRPIYIPDKLNIKREDVYCLIREALGVFGDFCSMDKIINIEFNF